jgi:hypothetical protein
MNYNIEQSLIINWFDYVYGCFNTNFNKYITLLINSMLLLSIQPKLSLQYKIINSANIKKLSQYQYWLSFLYWPSL